jgi:hypothetical protein
MMIAIFFWWIGLSIVVAVAANTRGRSPIAWFIYAIIFSPLLSGLLLLALPNLANSFAAGRMYLEGELRELEERRRRRAIVARIAAVVVVLMAKRNVGHGVEGRCGLASSIVRATARS